jgi:hypothetical protein
MTHVFESHEHSIREVKWQDIKFYMLGSDGDLIQLGVVLPGEVQPNPEIEVTIQVIRDFLYQPHITLGESLRRKGLAVKIYRALVEKMGHLYSGRGRRQNPMIDKVWNRLSTDTSIECAKSQIGDACWTKDNPDGESLKAFIG